MEPVSEGEKVSSRVVNSDTRKPVFEQSQKDVNVFFTIFFSLLVMIGMAIVLQFSAMGWTLSNVNKFSYEIAEDTITNLFIPAIPWTFVWFGFHKFFRHYSFYILSFLGLVNSFILTWKYYVTCKDNLFLCSWADLNSNTVTQLWYSEVVRVNVVVAVWVLVENYRCKFGWKHVFLWFLGSFLVGTETVLPLFLVKLKRHEVKNTRNFTRFPHASMMYNAGFFVTLITWITFLYRWAQENNSGSFVGLVETLVETPAGVHLIISIMLIIGSICVYALPNIYIRSSPASSYGVTWTVRGILTSWLIANTGTTLAFYLLLREESLGKSFYISKKNHSLFAKIEKNKLWFWICLLVASSVLSLKVPFHREFFTLQIMGYILLGLHALDIDVSEKFKSLTGHTLPAVLTIVVLLGIQCWSVTKIIFWMFLSTVRLPHILMVFAGYHGYKLFTSKNSQDTRHKLYLACTVVVLVSIYAQGVTNNSPMCMSPPQVTEESIVQSVETKIRSSSLPAKRPYHMETLGCLSAQLTVDPAISIQYRHGVFREPGKKYNGVIRVSSGDLGGSNGLGMSVKLFDVEGERLIMGTNWENKTQDFVMRSRPTLENESQYRLVSATLENTLNYIQKLVTSLTTDPEPNFKNPFEANYFSVTPFSLGSKLQVKYGARPCLSTTASTWKYYDPSDLENSFHNHSSSEDICFELLVQEKSKEDVCEEDISVPWTAPFVSIATIHIPKQQFASFEQKRYCEQLSFNPWQGITSHKPLGKINEQRKNSYLASFNARSRSNHIVPQEPTFEQLQQVFSASSHRFIGGNPRSYQYAFYPEPYHGLPKRVADLPKEGQFEMEKLARMFMYNAQGVINIQWGEARLKYQTKEEYMVFDDWKLFTDVPVAENWNKDEEFARQYRAGVNPMSLTWANATGLPKMMNLTNSAVAVMDQFLTRVGDSDFATLIRNGKIFYADYHYLEGIETSYDRVMHVPFVLLYLDRHDNLMPLCIQLTRMTQYPNQIYTPLDRPEVWTFAKMHVALADSLVHQMVYHLCFSHLAVEPLIVAFYRQLPASHPLMKFMSLHFRHTLAINDLGRDTMLTPGFILDRVASTGLKGALQLMEKAYLEDWTFASRSFPKELARRGLGENSEKILPNFFYRDDGFKVWNAMQNYSTKFVRDQFLAGIEPEKRDDAIRQDRSLQDLYRELSDPGLAGIPGINKFDSEESLIDFLTSLLWLCTAQHSAVNFGQYDYYSYIPNRPMTLRRSMPEDRNQVTWEYIYRSMPTLDGTREAIRVARFLSMPPDQGVDPITQEQLSYSLDDIVLSHPFPVEYTSFVKEMHEITKNIEERNKVLRANGDQEYVYLSPDKMASSISI